MRGVFFSPCSEQFFIIIYQAGDLPTFHCVLDLPLKICDIRPHLHANKKTLSSGLPHNYLKISYMLISSPFLSLPINKCIYTHTYTNTHRQTKKCKYIFYTHTHIYICTNEPLHELHKAQKGSKAKNCSCKYS